MRVYEHAYEYTGLVLLRDYSLIVSRFCAPVSESDHFAGYTIRPLEILCEFCGKRADFTWRIGSWLAEVDR